MIYLTIFLGGMWMGHLVTEVILAKASLKDLKKDMELWPKN